MHKDILFKNVNDQIAIIADENLSFEKFINSLKNRLEKLYIKDELLKTNVILDIRNLTLGTKQILSIFDVLAEHENIFVSKIIFKEKNKKNIILHEGNIRAGEIKLFSNNTLLIGNINKGSKVVINGNLYVIGKVSGIVEFKNCDNRLMAANIDNAYIKICSYEKQLEETIENSEIKVNNNEIVIGRFMDRREKNYGKSNCSYIW